MKTVASILTILAGLALIASLIAYAVSMKQASLFQLQFLGKNKR